MVVQNTGKGVVLQVDGRVEVCRVTISRYLYAIAPVRVGSGYRLEYYFIYFPVAVQKTGKRVVLQVDGSVEVCRVTISRYLNAPVRDGSGYRVEYIRLLHLFPHGGTKDREACGPQTGR